MAYGIRKLSKVQIGREGTPGTAIPATEIWRGPMTIPEDMRTRVFVDEDLGLRDPYARFYDAAYMAQLNMPSTPATFEQLVHIFEAGIDTIDGAQDSAGGYVYAYVLNAAANAVKTYTIEGGDNVDVVEMEYSFVTQFALSGRVDEAVMLESATWEGRQNTDTSFTGSLTPIAVEEILFNNCTFALDSTGGTIGTTPKAGTLTGFRLTVETGWRAVRGADGTLYFTDLKNVGGTAQLELTLEHDAIAAAERAFMRTGAVRLARLEFAGSAITGGATWTTKALRLDFEGQWLPESFRTLSNEDGDNIVTGTLRHVRDIETDNVGVQLTVVNERATL